MPFNKIVSFLALSSLSICALAHPQAQPKKDQIFSEARIIQAELAATKKARELGRAASFFLLDRHGDVIASYRMPKALPSTYGFAKAKAEAAVALGVPTDDLDKNVPQNILINTMTYQGGKYALFPGAYPVRAGNHLIGGLAISSTIVSLDNNVGNADTPHQDADIQCAKAALAVLTGKK